jgi:hypothetical protein
MYAILDSGLVPISGPMPHMSQVPHSGQSTYRAYIHSDGLARRLPLNPLAWAVLNRLGFTDMSRGYMAYAGPVVLAPASGQYMTESGVGQIRGIIRTVTLTPSDWDTYPKQRR